MTVQDRIAIVSLIGAIISGFCAFSTRSSHADPTVLLVLGLIACILYLIFLVWFIKLLCGKPDPKRRERVHKQRWDLVIHNDPLTSDATDEDFHKDRSNEDWHGM